MSSDRVARTETIDGLVTPAFIHNGNWFLIDLPVYADGLVDCWEMVDLALFRERLRTGWVAPGAPDGAEVHVHGLAAWSITAPRWELDADALYERVVAMVRELNPRMENLHDCHGRTVASQGGVPVRIRRSGQGKPVRVVDPGGWRARRVAGDALSVIVRDGEAYRLARARAYADGVIELARLEATETHDAASLREAVANGRIVGSVPAGARVEVRGLGSFEVREERYGVEPEDQLREVADLVDRLNGRADSVQRCRAAYEAYLADPTVARRDALRAAYEAVPEHRRMYVGDQDTKDVAVRMIVYGEQELEEWTHRVVARGAGAVSEEDLPRIDVPKPRDG